MMQFCITNLQGTCVAANVWLVIIAKLGPILCLKVDHDERKLGLLLFNRMRWSVISNKYRKK